MKIRTSHLSSRVLSDVSPALAARQSIKFKVVKFNRKPRVNISKGPTDHGKTEITMKREKPKLVDAIDTPLVGITEKTKVKVNNLTNHIISTPKCKQSWRKFSLIREQLGGFNSFSVSRLS